MQRHFNLSLSVQTVDGNISTISPCWFFAIRTIPAFISVDTVDVRIPAASMAFSFSLSVRGDNITGELFVEVGVFAVFGDCEDCLPLASVLLTLPRRDCWVLSAIVHYSKGRAVICWHADFMRQHYFFGVDALVKDGASTSALYA